MPFNSRKTLLSIKATILKKAELPRLILVISNWVVSKAPLVRIKGMLKPINLCFVKNPFYQLWAQTFLL